MNGTHIRLTFISSLSCTAVYTGLHVVTKTVSLLLKTMTTDQRPFSERWN